MLSPKQRESVYQSNKFMNVWEGPVRCGKSHSINKRFAEELVNGPDGDYLVTGKSENTIIKNVINPLNDMFCDVIRYKRNIGEFSLLGKRCYAVGGGDERSEGRIRGNTYAGALVDEGTLLPESFFRMLLTRLTVPNSKIFISTNTDSPYHWLKEGFLDNPAYKDKIIFKFNLEDNPSLTEQKKEQIKASYTGMWYKRFILGEWVLAEGAIYDFFDSAVHVRKEPPTYAKYYILGIDYGTTNPFAAVLIGFNDDCHPALWIEKEYYWDSKKTGWQKSDVEYALDLEKEFGQYPIRLMYLDPSAASFQVELKRRNKPVRPANNDVLDGIRFVAACMSSGDLVICKACINLQKEIESYVWDEKSFKDGLDRPLKTRDHALDAMRYAIYTHWGQKSRLGENPFKKPPNINPMDYPGWGPDSVGWQRY
jgi:PBSX family phage terminase large subunit